MGTREIHGAEVHFLMHCSARSCDRSRSPLPVRCTLVTSNWYTLCRWWSRPTPS